MSTPEIKDGDHPVSPVPSEDTKAALREFAEVMGDIARDNSPLVEDEANLGDDFEDEDDAWFDDPDIGDR